MSSPGLGHRIAAFAALAAAPFVSCLSVVERPAPPIGRAFASGSERAGDALRRARFDVDLASLNEADRGSWPVAEPEEPAVRPAALLLPARPRATVDPERVLAAVAKETFVFSEPRWNTKKIGYLRAGATVQRDPHPVGHSACEQGWYRVEPDGYVCVGKTATIDLDHPIVRLSARRPDTHAPLPYVYGMSEFPTPPLYTKLPSEREQRRVELDLAKHRARGRDRSWAAAGLEPVPELLEDGAPLPTWGGGWHSKQSVYSGRALVKSGFAFLSLFESGGRRFGLSVDLDVLPLDRLKLVEPSEFHGLALDDEVTLPVVFVRSKGARLYEGDPKTSGLRPVRPLRYREALPITGKRVRAGGVAYLELRGGGFVRDEHLVRVDPMKTRPGWATPGRTWLEVSILEQSLVAYEGTKPVYVTLVSTGADGLGDPKETHSTIRGQFLIHTKHLTTGMSGDEVGDEFDLREVPYVQYFTEGYALHAAYWHDSFGRPRSHGCINLSPIDARWLFSWTDPPVHEGWHGAMSLHEGTLVHVHP